MTNKVYSALPMMAAIKEMGQKFPRWNNVLQVAQQCSYAELGITLLSDQFGNSYQVDQKQLASISGAAPVQQKALPAATVDNQIDNLKKEINQTQGRALSKVEANINARLDRFEALLTSPE